MNFAPRTLIRFYNFEKTQHVTGVVLKDGQIFEITTRQTYDSFDHWKATRDMGGAMTVDNSKAEGIVIPSDWKGFTNSKGYTPHTDWIYCMMLEYTPHLLEREDVRNAFNNYQNVYADLVRKEDIYTSSCYIKKGQSALIKPYVYNIPAGYMRVYTSVARERVNKEFMSAYTPLYDLINSELLPHLTNRSEIERKKLRPN